MKKKLLIVLFAAAVTAAGTGAAVLAYLTDEDGSPNMVSLSDSTIVIQEEFPPPNDPAPGDLITKKPTVENTSQIPVFVRISALFSNEEGEKQCEPLIIQENWEQREDGYYYYSRELLPGERTEPLFEFVKLKEEVTKEELVPFDILVYAESVQSFGFSSPEEAFASL